MICGLSEARPPAASPERHPHVAPAQSISLGRRPGGSSGRDIGGASSGASSGSGGGGRTVSFGQPLFDLAMPKDEVKARLAPIPVYTVANPKNEFVLVAGEVGGEGG